MPVNKSMHHCICRCLVQRVCIMVSATVTRTVSGSETSALLAAAPASFVWLDRPSNSFPDLPFKAQLGGVNSRKRVSPTGFRGWKTKDQRCGRAGCFQGPWGAPRPSSVLNLVVATAIFVIPWLCESIHPSPSSCSAAFSLHLSLCLCPPFDQDTSHVRVTHSVTPF